MQEFSVLIFELVVLVLSVMVHEISHGYVAERLGDPTARKLGRLTFNPLMHLDLFGSFIFPLLLYFGSGGTMLFGWAKPVPYDPRFLKKPREDSGRIAAAGPASNFLIAAIFGIILRLLPHLPLVAPPLFGKLLSVVVYVNVLLGIFNLLPIPPLDGARVLFANAPRTSGFVALESFLERYSFMLLLVFVFFGFGLIRPLVQAVYLLFAGG